MNVSRNATLDINVPLSDSFSGDLNLAAGATLDINSPWAISAGTVDVNTPGVIVGRLARPPIWTVLQLRWSAAH